MKLAGQGRRHHRRRARHRPRDRRALCRRRRAGGRCRPAARRSQEDGAPRSAPAACGRRRRQPAAIDPGDGRAPLPPRSGDVDILVNGAGVFNMAPLAEITEADFDRQFDINVRGLLFTSQVIAGRHGRRRQGRQDHQLLQPGRPARRGACRGLLRDQGGGDQHHAEHGAGTHQAPASTSTRIAPGVIDTPMWDVVDSLFAKYEGRPIGEKKRLVGEAVPFGRMGVPEDIAGAAVFLASVGRRLHRCADAECRRRQLDELSERGAGSTTLARTRLAASVPLEGRDRDVQ